MSSAVESSRNWLRNKFNLVHNDLARYVLLIVWILINFIIFITVYFYYNNSLKYFYLRKIVQNGLSLARASAFCLNFNSVFLLLTVCRNLISITRPYLCCSARIVRFLDKHITYHRYAGYSIVFFSILHTLAHISNLERFVEAFNPYDHIKPSNLNSTSDDDLLAGLLSTLSLLPSATQPNGTYINPIRTPNANSIWETIKLLPGTTGVLMCISLSIIVSTASEYIRQSFYNLFWYSHQLFALIFLVALVLHGFQGVVRGQENLDRNNPEKCYLTYSDWSTQSKTCDIPQFAGSMATTWIWILAPLIIYMMERLTRFIRGLVTYRISDYKLHPSSVLELKIDNTSNNRIVYNAGQYIYLNVREISFLEWHPFTITSAPGDKYLTVHIRNAGDWTGNLIREIDSAGNKTSSKKISNIHIDGPYGTCADNIFKYKKCILIGAGIGVTPYASILKHILNNLDSKYQFSLKKVYFFWICPSMDTFEWFGQLLQKLESDLISKNRQHILDYNIYLTKGWSLREARQIVTNEDDDYDLFTGLQQKTNYGRPNFDLFFKEMSTRAANKHLEATEAQVNQQLTSVEQVGVFFCGPANLSSELHKLCDKYSNQAIRYIYNKESF